MIAAHSVLYSSLRPDSEASDGGAQQLWCYFLEITTAWLSKYLTFSWGSPGQASQSTEIHELAINHL